MKNCFEHLEVNDKRIHAAIFHRVAPKLKTIILGREVMVSFDGVVSILMQCTQLVHARFDNIAPPGGPTIDWPLDFDQTALRYLEIRSSYDDRLDNVITAGTFRPFRNLETLRCSEVHWCCGTADDSDLTVLPLKHLELSQSVLYQLPKMPPTLLELNISNSIIRDTPQNPSKLQKLSHLNLYGTTSDNRLLPHILWDASPHTLHLDFGNLSQPFVLFNFSEQYGLKHLRLRHQQLGDHDIDSFVFRFPSLETLRLERARISGVFIAALIRKPDNKLKYIYLEDCDNVSRDTIDYAKNLGVTVEVKSTQDIQGGRRIVPTR